MSDKLKASALAYHTAQPAGKLTISATKPLTTQRDLSLAYSPGVAYACEAIVDDEAQADKLTARGNLVAVISNGTAVLGLGAIGPLASKPVMEGKAVLFKKFAGIDVFDIEVEERGVEKFVDIVASLEPTFGGINLEDIKAPECFEIESKLRERMKIPVFHDDQHGTAIIVSAAIVNALQVVNKDIDKVRLVASGAGAASLACLDLLLRMGLKKENVIVTDGKGVINTRRSDLNQWKANWAVETEHVTLADAISGADIFLGLSAGGILKPEMLSSMADSPIVMALANPYPEIMPELAKETRDDVIIGTGRSDYPNQVNNVLCFPFIFRGALDVGATTINEEMKIAAVRAIANLAHAETAVGQVNAGYSSHETSFGPEYLIPKPFDNRLILEIAPEVAKAAMDSGVARRPIEDFSAYKQRLSEFVYRSTFLMKPLYEFARKVPKKVVFAEGEERRVLHAVQQILDEQMAQPILIGRPEVIRARIKELGLRMKPGTDLELVNIHKDDRYHAYWSTYHEIAARQGISPDAAKAILRTEPTAVASIMVSRNEADAMLCGTVGRFTSHLSHIQKIIGTLPGINDLSTMTGLILQQSTLFICDTHITHNPSAQDLAQLILLASARVREFGIEPKVALLSRSNFGSYPSESAYNLQSALKIVRREDPQLQVDGEMQADAALLSEVRGRLISNSHLKGMANLLIMPNVDAANIAHNLIKVLTNAVSVGPILLGSAAQAHILTQGVSSRGIMNMTAVASTSLLSKQ